MEQLMQLPQKASGALCVSWIQRQLRLGYSKACGLCDEALNAGLVMLANRETTDGSKEYAYVQSGHAPQMTLAAP
ncbi:hypothetical protein [Comamonas sp.]|uniref:hypothetical protein n=1 Tax=Comamonas sp. TaxID=34028 RepID=UPI00258274B5|nr:hypothetical protein [Comamonas sp.]